MISSLQPTRPKLPTTLQTTPFDQQQKRSHHSSPRSQIEAMPPHRTPVERSTIQISPAYNPALVHPVFFTNSWRKPPFAMPATGAFNPVATGYVFSNGKRSGNMTKL